jgi:hypothetical protein
VKCWRGEDILWAYEKRVSKGEIGTENGFSIFDALAIKRYKLDNS